MNAPTAMLELTTLEVILQMSAALVYLSVAVAAVGQAPRDTRTRVFLAFAIMSAVAFSIPVFAWALGVKDFLAMRRIPLALMLIALAEGALMLFHFSQVFPKRRAWIITSGIQLPVAYALIPAVVAGLTWAWPTVPTEATAAFAIAFLVFGFPLIVLLGVVLPASAIVSFLRSYRDAVTAPVNRDARPVLAAILLSQVAGGVLALVFAPVLARVAPDSFALTFVTITIWALGLLTPIAYAAGVWKYRLLDIVAV